MSTELYGARPALASQQTIYPYFVVRTKGDADLDSFQLHGEAEAGLNMAAPSSYYPDIPEAYASKHLSPEWTVDFGRHRFEWSRLDDVWEQGLWQPRFRWNYFEPEPAGLTGFFAEHHGDRVAALFFASPMMIPEQGATFNIKNGALTTDHPFFSVPPTTIPLFGQPAAVNYQLGTYNIASIVFHPGAGAMVRVGAEDGAWGKVSYAYQPLNQLLLGYDGYFSLGQNNINVTLYPRVLYHHLASFEGGYNSPRFKLWGSLTGDHPITDSTPNSWTTQQISPAVLASAGVDGILWGEGELAAHGQANYLYRWSGVLPDQGPLAVANGSLFESRFTVQDAVSGVLEIPLTHSFRHRVQLRTRVVYDFSVGGALFTSELRYENSERWVLTLGGDMIGAERKQSQAEGGADMFFLYQNDDRIRGAITYVF